MKPPHPAPRALLAAPTLCAAAFLMAACTSRPPAEPSRPVAAPAPVAVPVAPPVTSDRGRRTLLPSPIGQLAPEDMPTAPTGGK